MSTFTVGEVTRFFQSYGLKCDEKLIEEWVNEKSGKANNSGTIQQISEDDIYSFNDWCRWKGTAYEKGIDDRTKIDRLFEEINGLKKEIETLKTEKIILEEQLGILPF